DYGWMVSIVYFAASRGRPGSMAGPAGQMAAKGVGMTQTNWRLFGLDYGRWLRDAWDFTKVAAGSGAIIGTPLYLLRQYGVITEKTDQAVTEAEKIHHRLHWLHLDCRARYMQKLVASRQYASNQDKALLGDAKQMNRLLNDFNFLIDVSQLYYAKVKWPDS